MYPKATDHIPEINSMISQLVSTGFAYEEKGSVYFRVSAFNEYGKLARLKMQVKDNLNLTLQYHPKLTIVY